MIKHRRVWKFPQHKGESHCLTVAIALMLTVFAIVTMLVCASYAIVTLAG